MTTLITGASRGIGLALAQHFAGLHEPVIGTCRSGAPGVSGKVEWQHLDVTDLASLQNLAAHLKGRPLDLLVCNAGVYLEKHDTTLPPEIWAQCFAVNVTGVYLTIQHLLPNIRAGKGKIAIISSTMGSQKRAPGGSYVYRASKAAALNLGRNLASALKREGIAVGIYHPGWVTTDMGGPDADIGVEESVAGLAQRFKALSLQSTGCFESYDGTSLEY